MFYFFQVQFISLTKCLLYIITLCAMFIIWNSTQKLVDKNGNDDKSLLGENH